MISKLPELWKDSIFVICIIVVLSFIIEKEATLNYNYEEIKRLEIIQNVARYERIDLTNNSRMNEKRITMLSNIEEGRILHQSAAQRP